MPRLTHRTGAIVATLATLSAVAVFNNGGVQPVVAGEGDAGETNDQQGFAVVELFTSEGCSSCPPADRLLAQIDDFAQASDLPVYALSFHVDYWNQLGWADPYSSAQHTARQRTYAAAAGERSVYTPQLIVNGEERFVGSDAKRAQSALNAALTKPTDAVLRVEATEDAGTLVVRYETATAPEDAVVNVALVQADGSQSVSRGENTGRTLRHVNIVRAFRSASIDPSGAGTVRLEDGPELEGPTRVIVYLQDPRTKRIVSAASTTVS
ncbi:MAG: DUF1223 domain-containing protein [Planctomycetota bacterium]